MKLPLTAAQIELRKSLRSHLQQNWPYDTRRSASDWAPRRELWQSLIERFDRFSAGTADEIAWRTQLVMQELGAALVSLPYLETMVIAAGLLRGAGGADAERVLRRIATGEAIHAWAWAEPQSRHRLAQVEMRARRCEDGWVLDGDKIAVSCAPWAQGFIVLARSAGERGQTQGLSLFQVDRDQPGLSRIDYPTVDDRCASDLHFDGVKLPARALLGSEGEAFALVDRVGDEAIAAQCAEAIGLMQRLLDDTVAFTRQRRQFGQPIAGFQVLQHRMVDMFLQLEMAQAATVLATLNLGSAPAERAQAASAAKVTVGEACRYVGQNAIQLHGGLGMTEETPATLGFRRLSVIEHEFGSVDHHLARFGALSAA